MQGRQETETFVSRCSTYGAAVHRLLVTQTGSRGLPGRYGREAKRAAPGVTQENRGAMTAVFEHIRKSDLAPASALARKAVAIKTALAASWPPAMIGLGFLLTLAWSGGLLWLFVRTIVALV